MNNTKKTEIKKSKIIPTIEIIQRWIDYANKNDCNIDLIYDCFSKYIIHIRPGDNAEKLKKNLPKVYGGNGKNIIDIWSK